MEARLVEFNRKNVDGKKTKISIDTNSVEYIEPIDDKQYCLFFKSGKSVNLAHSYDEAIHRLEVCSKIKFIPLASQVPNDYKRI